MSIHRPHPLKGKWMGKEFNDPEDALLFDECQRCSEHSKMIFSIDNDRLKQLWLEMLKVEYSKDGRDYYRTHEESRLCGKLYEMSIFMERILGIKPEEAMVDAQSLGATFSVD